MFYVQFQQALNLFLLLVIGKYFFHIYLPWSHVALLFCLVIFFEHGILFFKEKKLTLFSFSSLSTVMGVVLMLVSPHVYIYIIVLFVALVQKHFLTVNGRHFFNPSNFALMSALLFFYKDAHIVLGQLGDATYLKILVIVLAIGILIRVKRWVIPVVFVCGYLLMQYFLVVQHDPVMLFEEIYHRFYSVSFVVFVLFMLTDPATTPHSKMLQSLFALLVALFAVVLDHWYGFRVQHLFMALFILSVFVPLTTQKSLQPRLAMLTLLLASLALSAIIFIESKPPYYFEMNG